MATPRHYVPAISRFLVSALYHEGKRRHMPMTRLVNELLTNSLTGTPGWQAAKQAQVQKQENRQAPHTHQDQPIS